MIEVQADTGEATDPVLKQYVWGLGYIDALVQVGVNQDPRNANDAAAGADTENLCERFFWPMQDARTTMSSAW